jgi:hypothetical protein
MSREASFTFVPEKLLTSKKVGADSDRMSATVNTKYGTLQFSKGYVEFYNLKNKFITLYGDSAKKAIAWKIFEDGSLNSLSHVRRITMSKATNVPQPISVKKILDALLVKKEDSTLRKLPIKKYKEASLLENGEYHYVVLKQASEIRD